MPTFKNTANGYTESVDNWSMLWALLFGWIYFGVRGLWAHIAIQVLIVFGLAAATGGAGALIAVPIWIVYAILTPTIIRQRYLKAGWVEVRNEPEPDYWTAGRSNAPKVSSSVVPGGAATPAKATAPSVADELTKLAALRDRGVLTEDEFLQQKKEVLLARGR